MGVNLYKLGRESLEKKYEAGKGRSKYNDKRNNSNTVPEEYIYTYQTKNKYLVHFRKFNSYLISRGVKAQDFEEMVSHLQEYLDYLSVNSVSSWTQKLVVSAVRKATDVYIPVHTSPARRQDIKRSRSHANDRFILAVYEKYPDTARLCLCVGPRKNKELAVLRGTDLRMINGQYYVHIRQGKNGQERNAPVIGSAEEIRTIVKLFRDAGNRLVIEHLPGKLDVHALRAIYACRVYLAHARPLGTLGKKEKYYFRAEMKGTVTDRAAMLMASEALGHHRISVIASHYMWALEYVESTDFQQLFRKKDKE